MLDYQPKVSPAARAERHRANAAVLTATLVGATPLRSHAPYPPPRREDPLAGQVPPQAPGLLSKVTPYSLSSMTIKHGFLALLEEQPLNGFQLKRGFEDRTGELWPLNVGQVYTTLQRLERDELVAVADEEDGHKRYALTSAGREVLDEWFTAPVVRQPPERDELVLKVGLALAVEGIDVIELLRRQRTATLEVMQVHAAAKAAADPDDLAWLAILDSLLLQAEAEIRWLDLCEQRVLARPNRERSDTRRRQVAEKRRERQAAHADQQVQRGGDDGPADS